MIKIIIADDHQMFIDGIKSLLESEKSLSIIGEALNGKQVLELLEKKKADIILMDINMPEMDGLEATKIISKKYTDVRVIMLTMYNTRDYIAKMISAGASGYILKNTGKKELMNAIQTVHGGQTFYSEEVTARIMESFRNKDKDERINIELTAREKDVLKLLAQDLTSHEIGEKLNLSSHTIETHRKNLLSKLQARSTVGLVKSAMEMGMLD